MAAILRWFDINGERHRAWFRATGPGTRELVLAGPCGEVATDAVPAGSLEELTETQLAELAENLHAHR